MTCENVTSRLYAYADGTLEAAERKETHSHLDSCPRCAREAAAIHDIESRVRTAFRDDPPSAGLWPQIRCSIEAERVRRGLRTGRRRFLRMTLATVSVVSLTLAMSLYIRAGDARLAPPIWLVEAPVHDLRTFLASKRPLDIGTRDAALLRRWFVGKVDFRPPAPSTRGAGLELVGGRLCYFLHRRAVSYVYRSGKHLVSFFAFPGAGLGLPTGRRATGSGPRVSVHEVNGFTNVLWGGKGLVYALVSDAPRARVLRTAQLLTRRSP